jgi:hypothetical protein
MEKVQRKVGDTLMSDMNWEPACEDTKNGTGWQSGHEPECFLAGPCRSNDGGEHIPQGTVAGFPVSICGMCMDDCICDRISKAEVRGFHRGYPAGVEWYKTVTVSYGKRKYAEALYDVRMAVEKLVPITINSLKKDGSTPAYDVVKVDDVLNAIKRQTKSKEISQYTFKDLNDD